MQSHLLQTEFVLIVSGFVYQAKFLFIKESSFCTSDTAVEISSPTATSKSIQSKWESKPAFYSHLNGYKAIDIVCGIFPPWQTRLKEILEKGMWRWKAESNSENCFYFCHSVFHPSEMPV